MLLGNVSTLFIVLLAKIVLTFKIIDTENELDNDEQSAISCDLKNSNCVNGSLFDGSSQSEEQIQEPIEVCTFLKLLKS